MKIWCAKILFMKKYVEKLEDGRNVLREDYSITTHSTYGSFVTGKAIDRFAELEAKEESRQEQESKQFVFRNVRCWLATEWVEPNCYHFNFAPLGSDFVDEKGDTYFIHCTYEPKEENKFWFSYWYENECYEPTMDELTEAEREQIKVRILKEVCSEEELLKICEKMSFIEETAEPCDNQGYEYFIDCQYREKTYNVYISVESTLSAEMQGARQIYEQIHGIKLNFQECIWLIHDCIKTGILKTPADNPNNILIYRLAGENTPEGWYSENIHRVASELCDDYNGQVLLRSELDKQNRNDNE